MKGLYSTLLFIIISFSAQAQLDNYLNSDETLIEFSLNVVTLKNPSLAYKDGQKYGPYLAPGVSLTHYNFDQWGFRWGMDFKWTTDIFPEIYSLWRTDYLDRGKVPMLTGLWWTNAGTNVYNTEYFNIGVGAHFADYLIEIPDWDSTGNINAAGQQLAVNYQEPTGWYWAIGPTLYLDAVYKSLLFSVTSNYSFSYWRPPIREKEYEDAINKIEGYPSPHFLYVDITANHDSGFFISFNRTMAIDRGINANKFSRNDLRIGWKF
tara:strand:- start:22264 stop:23055 length:792 start_codon:yes stop_codon:yes gene_type:complete